MLSVRVHVFPLNFDSDPVAEHIVDFYPKIFCKTLVVSPLYKKSYSCAPTMIELYNHLLVPHKSSFPFSSSLLKQQQQALISS